MIESKRDPASLTRRGDAERHYAWAAELWLHDKADADRLLGRSAGADRAGGKRHGTACRGRFPDAEEEALSIRQGSPETAD